MEVPDGSPEENPMEAGGYEPDEVLNADDIIDDTDMFNSNEMMDFDEDKKSEDEERVVQKPHQPVTVDRAIIDLEPIVQSFKANALIIRLTYIAEVCPPLRADALRAMIESLRSNSQNTNAYAEVYQKIDALRATGGLRADEQFPPLDQEWLEQTTQRANARLDAYHAEFRRQKDDGVKESIRRAMNDVFNQHLAMGKVEEALKLYSRGIREYCTSANVLIEMLLNWITATVYAEQWNKLGILIPQAERAISEVEERDSSAAAAASASSQQGAQRIPTGASTSGTRTARSVKELITFSNAKVSAVSGLAAMKNGTYRTAAHKFLSIDLESFNYPELLSPSDIAVYGAICALATFDRNELKTKVLGSSQFRKFLESEPKLIDLLQRFCRNQFGESLDILAELRDQLFLNVYITPHVTDLYALIRRRAIVQYFQPYMTADMKVMAIEFRTDVEELEGELVDLIRCGSLKARIDAHEQTLEAKINDRRSDVYDRAHKVNKTVNNIAEALMLRATLQEMKCVVGLDPNASQAGGAKHGRGHGGPAEEQRGRRGAGWRLFR